MLSKWVKKILIFARPRRFDPGGFQNLRASFPCQTSGVLRNPGGLLRNPGGLLRNPGGLLRNPGGLLRFFKSVKSFNGVK
jgi:hypothetical protein